VWEVPGDPQEAFRKKAGNQKDVTGRGSRLIPMREGERMKYKHYSLDKAEKEYKQGLKRKYKVTTINWTFASQDKGKIDYSKVHKNQYIWTLRYLIKWIRRTEDVAEDIILIEALEGDGNERLN